MNHAGYVSSKFDKYPDGQVRVRISRIVLPCPGVALRFSGVIDCTPGEDPMPPVTIDIFNKTLSPLVGAAAGDDGVSRQSEGGGAPRAAEEEEEGPQQEEHRRFTFSCGDFVTSSQTQLYWVKAMVAAAGLPRECAGSVYEFSRLCAVSASNTFYASVAITVKADAPGNIVDEDDDDEDEVAPDGAETDDCCICYRPYVIGGATSVKLACGHMYHRSCLDRWTRMKATCPYCCRPAQLTEDDCFWAGESDDLHEEDGVGDTSGHDEYSSSTWARIRGVSISVLGFFSNLATRPGRLF